MAFAETRAAASPRIIQEAAGICKVPIAEAIMAGDCLGITSATWVLSASATVEHPLLVAIESGVSGDTIACALMAVIKCTTTSTNVATVGEIVALHDSGYYVAAGSNLPDVGFVASIGSDSLSAILVVCPMAPQLTTQRA